MIEIQKLKKDKQIYIERQIDNNETREIDPKSVCEEQEGKRERKTTKNTNKQKGKQTYLIQNRKKKSINLRKKTRQKKTRTIKAGRKEGEMERGRREIVDVVIVLKTSDADG